MALIIKGYRNMANVKVNEISKILGISRQSYNAKENGKTPFTDNKKVVIKGLLSKRLNRDFTIDELFF